MKELIKTKITKFSDGTLTENALAFFKTLGYDTSLTITQTKKTYQSFKENFIDNSPNKDRFNEAKAFTRDWKSIDFLFQLADNLGGIKGGKFDNQIINSVVFACIELSTTSYSRTQLAEITRQVNVLFAMPVVLLFKYNDNITLSVIHRRINKKDEQKDVLEKVSLIKDISITKTHAAHISILQDFAFPNLANKKNPTNFVELTNAWEVVFNTKTLNKEFFKKIANWYFLSVAYSQFPYEYLKSDPKYKDKTNAELQELANQKATIRFITRMIFVWFLKEKGLISNDFFDKNKVAQLLKKFNIENSSDYYNAILQNLFFATLNKAKEHREFALDLGHLKNKSNYDVNSLYRYENMFQDASPENIMKLFENIPFLNGGLFDSLDNKENKEIIDGFSRTEKNQAKMPDFLFFEEEELDFDEVLNKTYETKNKKYEVKGLFEIFNEYKFTIEENTPTETDVALDPYLLGEIFENLLAYYNPETGTTARKGSGSFYTPQEIVNYMVDESLKAYLDTKIPFDFKEIEDLTESQKTELVKALSEVKILDPACGSGAFPMGVLYKMVDMLKHIDPDNIIWKQIQHDKIIGDKIAELEADKKAIEGLSDKQVKEKAAKAVEDRLNELETIFNNEYNFDDYARKLYIIQNCIYGVDIQDVAIQISKLRFFLSLIVDQKNEDIKPLPNLETKFVIANTLIGIDLPKFTVMGEDDHSQDTTKALKEELKHVREHHFKAVTRKEKLAIKEQDKAIREKIANSLADVATNKNLFEIEEQQKQIEKLKKELLKANDLPETEEIETGTLFEIKKEITYPRKNKIAEINRSIKSCENKIEGLQTNTQAELIRAQALKIAQWDIYNQNAQADWFDMDWMFGIQDGFDVVIGNPPYVQIKQIEENDKAKFIKHFKFATGRFNLFYFFIEISERLLKKNGITSYIIPDRLLLNSQCFSLREWLLNKQTIIEITSFDESVFESAVVDSIIIIYKNISNDLDFVKANSAVTIENLNVNKPTMIPKKYFIESDNKQFSLNYTSEKSDLINKIKKDTLHLGMISETRDGIIQSKIPDVLFLKNKKNSYCQKLLFGKDINNYSIDFDNNWVNYNHKEMMKIELERDGGGLRLRTKDIFERFKILTRQTADRIIATYDQEYYYYSNTIHGTTITDNKFDALYVLALLNCKLLNYYYKSTTSEGGKVFAQIKIEVLRLLPIKYIKHQQPFITLVNQILSGKKSGQDTSQLEHQIDVMVYHVYGLSYEEACVVDGGLSKEDFEKYRIE